MLCKELLKTNLFYWSARSSIVRVLNVVAMVVFALALAPKALGQQVQIDKNNRTLSVTATYKASAVADIAVIQVGFASYGTDEESAYAEGSRRSNAISKALRETGLADASIASQDQLLSRTAFNQEERLSAEEQTTRRFTISQSWTIQTTASNAALLLHAAITAGANQSGHVDWELANRDSLQAQAAAKALAKARAIASEMAQGLGVQLGPLVYASNQAPSNRFFPMLNTMASVAGVAAKQSVSAPLVLHPDEVEESATVYAVFSID